MSARGVIEESGREITNGQMKQTRADSKAARRGEGGGGGGGEGD
jgi:hypothetical protein